MVLLGVGGPRFHIQVTIAAAAAGSIDDQGLSGSELVVKSCLLPFNSSNTRNGRWAFLRVTEIAVFAGDVDVAVRDLGFSSRKRAGRGGRPGVYQPGREVVVGAHDTSSAISGPVTHRAPRWAGNFSMERSGAVPCAPRRLCIRPVAEGAVSSRDFAHQVIHPLRLIRRARSLRQGVHARPLCRAGWL